MKPRITETHKRDLFAYIDRHALGRLIASHVGAEHGMHPSDPAVTFKIEFVDETEGSPSYRVGTAARVSLTRDLSALYASAELPAPETPPSC